MTEPIDCPECGCVSGKPSTYGECECDCHPRPWSEDPKYQRIEQERLGYGPAAERRTNMWQIATPRQKRAVGTAALIVAVVIILLLSACGRPTPLAAGHHVDGDCYGFVVYDTPFVTETHGTFDVGSHPWPDGVTSLTGTQNNGTEDSSVSKPDDCEPPETTQVTETTTQETQPSTPTTTPTTEATTTTSTPSGGTTSTTPSTTSSTQPTTSSSVVVTVPPSSSTTSPPRSTVPPRPSGPSGPTTTTTVAEEAVPTTTLPKPKLPETR